MKKIFPLLFVCSLILGVSRIVKAQTLEPPMPPGSMDVSHTSAPIIEESPWETLNQFIMLCNDDSLRNVANYVDGADRDNPDWKIVSDAITYDFQLLQLSFTDFKVTRDAADKDIYHTEFKLILADRIFGFGMANIEQLTMKRCVGEEGGEYWQIVPQKSQYNPKQKPFTFGDIGVIGQLAVMAAHPKVALSALYLRQSIPRLKQLGLTLFMFTQDYNDKIDLTPQNYVQKLMPYVFKDNPIFTAPDDAPGTISFQINPSITGLNIENLLQPSKTIAFYLGHNQKLDFRYGELSPICFVDGHVKAVDREEAKSLRWKP